MRKNIFSSPFVEAVHYHLHQNEMPSIELCVRLKMTNAEFTQLMNNECPLSEKTAEMLELIFRTPAHEWLKLANKSQQLYYMDQA